MDGATQIPISEIEASTTQEFVSCTFRSVNSKAAYFISANNCSRSHINFGQTGGDLSFGVPYPFQRHWPHGVFHQKMRRSRNLQFLCSLFLSFGFFLTSTCPPLKHHQPCAAKSFAASTQHWCLWKNKASKTAGSYEPLRIDLLQRFLFLRAHLPRRLFVQKGSVASV